eukprot:5643417-Amphidinium_carterae.1
MAMPNGYCVPSPVHCNTCNTIDLGLCATQANVGETKRWVSADFDSLSRSAHDDAIQFHKMSTYAKLCCRI